MFISFVDGFPSGQRERTVNPLAQPTMVRIHPHPPEFAGMAELADAHGSGPCGVTPMQVQVLFPAPRRSKRLRACSDFFATTLAHARRCPSLQLTPRCRGFNLNFFGTPQVLFLQGLRQAKHGTLPLLPCPTGCYSLCAIGGRDGDRSPTPIDKGAQPA